jgi:hypothetical protein
MTLHNDGGFVTLTQLKKERTKLLNDIKLGIDTEDTWIDLDFIRFAIQEQLRIIDEEHT